MKALLHFSASSRLRERLAAISDIQMVVVEDTDDEAFEREIADADVLLHVLKPVTAEMIAKAPKLRLIQKVGVGVNTIDRIAAADAGVAVANIPGANTAAVAEHTLCLMLATLRRVTAFDAGMRHGDARALFSRPMDALGELNGSKIGFIGYGAVPQRLAPVLSALGAKVRFWNHVPKPSDNAAESVSFDDVITDSDIVSLHVPLLPDTRYILDRHVLARLKKGAVIINTARGGLIEENALMDQLREGRIAGAGLDVFETEPADNVGELASFPTVVVTPHIAWLTPQMWDRSIHIILENCRRLASGETILNRVAAP